MTSLLRLANSHKKLLVHIFIRWWMDFTICIQKVMLIVTSNHRIFYSHICLYSNWLILDFLAYWKVKMELVSSIRSWEQKGIWRQKLPIKNIREKAAISLLQELYCSLCMLEILLSKKQRLTILTINSSNRKNTTLFGKLIWENDQQITSRSLSRIYLWGWSHLSQQIDLKYSKLPLTLGLRSQFAAITKLKKNLLKDKKHLTLFYRLEDYSNKKKKLQDWMQLQLKEPTAEDKFKQMEILSVSITKNSIQRDLFLKNNKLQSTILS